MVGSYISQVLKQRIQTGAHKTTWDALIYSIQRDGIFGLFSKGKLASQIARDVPYSIVVLISYELLQNAVKIFLLQHVDENHTKLKVINNELHSSYNRTSIVDNRFYYGHILHYPRKVLLVVCRNRRLRDALCGSIAGGFGSLFTNPMDVVKTRLMTDTQYQSVITAVYHIYRKEGLATFFRGSMPRLLHKIPANALFFLCYESLRSLLGVPMTKS
jgi:solute carrier family 25 S-adenosylmethionine transporter 26